MAGRNNKAGRTLGGKVRAGVAHLFRPGAWFRGNAFPENAIAASALRRGNEGYGTNQRANIAKAVAEAQQKYPNLPVVKQSNSRSSSIAHVATGVLRDGTIRSQKLVINTAAPFWKNPKAEAVRMRRVGWMSSSSPGHVIRHETGHVVHPPTPVLRFSGVPRNAGRVSRYGATSAMEFMAETYAGLRSGQRYPARVMREYRRLREQGKPNGTRNPKPQRIFPRTRIEG